MFALYVFSLVLGGGFLALSLLGGIFGAHGDVGADAGDLHAPSLGVHGDADGLHGHLHGDAGVAHGHAAPTHDSVAAKVFSVRTIAYALFGFGAVGTTLSWLWAGRSPLLTGGLAAATGIFSGWLINMAFAWVRRSESGALETEEEWAGHTGHVKLPIAGQGGLVVVERAGRNVELRALPHASALGRGDPSRWKSVVVVEMEHGIARVAPVDDEQLLKP